MVKNKMLPKNKIDHDDVPRTVAPYQRSKEDIERERRWKAEDGLRAIQKADEVKRDSKLMRDVKSLACEQMDALKKVAKAK